MPTTDSRRVTMREDLSRPFRYATQRNPQLRTRGGKIDVLAHELGNPLKPHQRYIADVATELNPPGSHFVFRYQRIIVAEPRQVGKTTLLRPVMLDRALMLPRAEIYMTAQKGKDASDFWTETVDEYERSPFASFVNVKRGKGSEVCEWPNQSRIRPFAPVPDALHGKHPHLATIDECWAFSSEGGRNVMRAVRPAQQTRRARQLWLMSAAGSPDSEWWHELVEVGRASVDDPSSDTAYFEHSMHPDADPYDPESWEFHPGLDGLITLDDLANEAKPANNTHADFLRGFMNVSTTTRDNPVLDLDDFASIAGPVTVPDPTAATFAYDVAIDRTAATVYSAWPADDGGTQLRIVETRERDDWLPEFAANVAREHGVTMHAYDGGPARAATDALERAGVQVDVLTGTDRATAWAAFKGSARARTLTHDGSPAVRAALQVAVEREFEDETRLSRRHSLGPIDPLISALTARWFADRATPTVQVF